jgi:uncharacterized protein
VIGIQETAGGVSFAVKVQPRARRNAVLGELGGTVKIALTAPPVDGRANEACIEFLADVFHVPRGALAIVSGENSRSKVIRISGISAHQLRAMLDAQLK